MDGVLPADSRGVAAGRADQRPQAGEGTHGVLALQVGVEHVVDVLEDLVDLVERGHGPVGRAVVGLVGGAHEPGAGVGDEEEHATGDRAGSCPP